MTSSLAELAELGNLSELRVVALQKSTAKETRGNIKYKMSLMFVDLH